MNDRFADIEQLLNDALRIVIWDAQKGYRYSEEELAAALKQYVWRWSLEKSEFSGGIPVSRSELMSALAAEGIPLKKVQTDYYIASLPNDWYEIDFQHGVCELGPGDALESGGTMTIYGDAVAFVKMLLQFDKEVIPSILSLAASAIKIARCFPCRTPGDRDSIVIRTLS